MSLWSDTPVGAKVGVIAGLLPFVIHIETFQTSGSSCSYMDFAALIGGAIAILGGGGALMSARSPAGEGSSAGARYGSGLLALGLGLLQVLIGLGIVLSPCP